MWAVLESLQPAPQLAKLVQQTASAIRTVGSGHRRYSLLHLTLDKEWEAHCKQLQQAQPPTTSKLPQDDCVGDVAHIDQVCM
jgi:hypothetical protein